MSRQTAIIIGAGPAGLTAAYELLTRTEIQPIVLEQDEILGGLSRTVNYKGNRIDIGGHRFFSKSDRVMNWWLNMLPLERHAADETTIAYHQQQRPLATGERGADPRETDAVMLIRPRKSRIYYLRKLFDYPLSLSAGTIRNLGLLRTLRIGLSYLWIRAFPLPREENLEQFMINRFGRELYETFFKSYTEKVWGVRCDQLSASWGAQRIKGLSVGTALLHALKRPFQKRPGVSQKGTETSLIEQFLYPKLGPGQMWEVCAEKIVALGGHIKTRMTVDRLRVENQRVVSLSAIDRQSGRREQFSPDYCFSTMAVKDLMRAIDGEVPERLRSVSEGLVYRDFLTVGLLVKKLVIRDHSTPDNATPDNATPGNPTQGNQLLKDNWIYVQEPDVKVGRLQIFNNWSPYMVADPAKVWLGLEYFCNEGDELWSMDDEHLARFAARELAAINIIAEPDVLDFTVLRMPKTYPAYYGTYDRFHELREYFDRLENLYLIGRNGMHRYNNQDHSMLTAMTAVDNLVAGRKCKANIWSVNTEQEYHEEQRDRSEG